MRILGEKEMETLGLINPENSLQSKREQEIIDFWDSGALAAELPVYGCLTINTEKDYYKRAMRKVARQLGFDWVKDIKFSIRKGQLIVIREKSTIAVEQKNDPAENYLAR